jgi:hypothetical protein
MITVVLWQNLHQETQHCLHACGLQAWCRIPYCTMHVISMQGAMFGWFSLYNMTPFVVSAISKWAKVTYDTLVVHFGDAQSVL